MRSYHNEWFNGYMAAKKGEDSKSNPYVSGSKEAVAWKEGWDDYHFERAER